MRIYSVIVCASLGTSATAILVSLWDSQGCHGFNDLFSSVVKEEDGCHQRGDILVDLELDGRGGLSEQAIAVSGDDPSEASEMVVLFSSDDCSPDNVIANASFDNGCSGKLKGWDKPVDYKSWAVWDLCEGKDGCSLD